MSFLKRIFSLKSIKSKKKQKQQEKQQIEQQQQQQQQQTQHQPVTLNSNDQLQIVDDHEHEAAVGRLLRSSSARYAVVSELDYTSLPPLPHPINNVVQTPAASTVSLSSSSTSHRGTYTVQVHKRKRHASTEFPFANRHLDDDVTTPQRTRGATAPPKEHAHYLGLRSDPSVASLLDLYDDHGRLPEEAFANTPPNRPSSERREGRAQARRSGSTLRQLLGVSTSGGKSDSNSDLTEGDISWAERFLGEFDGVSSQASLPLRMQNTPKASLVGNASRQVYVPNDECMDHDFSMNSESVDNPTLNSMEVELSMGSNSSGSLNPILEGNSPYMNSASKSPQRASQVFTFLTQKRRPGVEVDRPPLPKPMSRSSSASSSMLTYTTNEDSASQFSCESSTYPTTPLHHDNRIPGFVSYTPNSSSLNSPLTSSRIPAPADRLRSPVPRGPGQITHRDGNPEREVGRPISQDRAHANEVKVLMTGPTKVIVTAPTPSTARGTPSRIPRGPRGPTQKCSSSSLKRRSLLTERSNSCSSSPSTKDPRSGISRPYKLHHRASNSSFISESDPFSTTHRPTKNKGNSISSRTSTSSSREKENRSVLSVKADLPSTPVRSHSVTSDPRSLFRAIVTPSGYRLPSAGQPSPASSSELSPVGRQLMTDVRQQRMKAREAERERNKLRGERHGSAYVA